jgi:3-deoxy-D-manno-octulosonate 8-phosphate phosphatase (KDO 8-P phosphatase)
VSAEPTVAERAANVRMLIMDCDGVLTDGRAIYGSGGFESLAFNVKDGTGIKYLHRAGLRTAILSGRDVEAVRARAAALGIYAVEQGAKLKVDAYRKILAGSGLTDQEVAYIGDDLPDLPVMRRAGLAVAVADAVPEVIAAAHMVTERRGGDAAVRELAEFLLKTQGKWAQIMERYER